MKIKTILKTLGSPQILLGVILIPMLIFLVNTIAPSMSAETLLFTRCFVDVVTPSNIGIGFLLIVAVFNTFHAGIIVESGQPSPFWILLIAKAVLCRMGY